MTQSNLRAHELISLTCRVVSSNDPGYTGIKGTVVEESTHTLTIDTGDAEKKITKAGTVFEFTLPDGSKAEIIGDEIDMNPVERTKRLA